MNRLLAPLFVATALLLGACSSSPPRPSSNHVEAARIAASMEGKPYKYGGHSPDTGFDCAGLVQYSYGRVGMKVPRTTHAQRDKSLRVPLDQLNRGDLLFFTQESKFSSHVGIYLGDNRFIHAPSTGKRLRIDDFRSAYWQKHFVDARRF
jgi:murein DD-endopeptidase